MYITMPFMSKLWCHNAAKESTCDLWTWASESQRAKAAGFNQQKTVWPTSMMFPRWKLLNWKNFAQSMELMRLIRKRNVTLQILNFKFYPSQLTHMVLNFLCFFFVLLNAVKTKLTLHHIRKILLLNIKIKFKIWRVTFLKSFFFYH